MTESARAMGPIAFLSDTLRLTASFTIALTLITSPALIILYEIRPEAIGLAFAGIITFSVLIGQDFLQDNIDNHSDNISGMKGHILTLLGLSYYNLAILFGSLLGSVAVILGYPNAALIIALAYPLWDVTTFRYGIPVSLGGLIGFTIGLLVLVGALTNAARVILSDAGKQPFVIVGDNRLVSPKRRGGRLG